MVVARVGEVELPVPGRMNVLADPAGTEVDEIRSAELAPSVALPHTQVEDMQSRPVRDAVGEPELATVR